MSENSAKTFFDILGIPVTNRDELIYQAYLRRKAEAQGDVPLMRQIEEAYKTLSNPINRQKYVERLKKEGLLNQAPGKGASSTESTRTIPYSSGGGMPGPQKRPDEKGPRRRTEILSIDDLSTPIPEEPVENAPSREPTDVFEIKKPGDNSTTSTPAASSSSKTDRFNNQPSGQPVKSQPEAATGKKGRRTTEIMSADDLIEDSAADNSGENDGERGVEPQSSAGSDHSRQKTDVFEIPAGLGQNQAEQKSPRREETSNKIPAKSRTDDSPMSGGQVDGTLIHQTEPQPRVYKVEVMFHGEREVFSLSPGQNIIGRKPKQGEPPPIVIDDGYVSRQHAVIFLEGNEYFVMDLSSKNGTQLNGKKIEPDIKKAIKPGDEIEIEKRKIHLIEG